MIEYSFIKLYFFVYTIRYSLRSSQIFLLLKIWYVRLVIYCRLERPTRCPTNIWNFTMEKMLCTDGPRVSFTEIRETIEQMIQLDVAQTAK